MTSFQRRRSAQKVFEGHSLQVSPEEKLLLPGLILTDEDAVLTYLDLSDLQLMICCLSFKVLPQVVCFWF